MEMWKIMHVTQSILSSTVHVFIFLTVCRITLDSSKSQHDLLEKAEQSVNTLKNSLKEKVGILGCWRRTLHQAV